MRESPKAEQTQIADWGRRVSDARARLRSEIRAVTDISPLRRESQILLQELTLAFEELQVAEEELRVQTDELTSRRLELQREQKRTAELQRTIEDQEQAARAAEVARQAAERASHEKSELIAIVSHELRTPLAAIGGYAELLALDIPGGLNAPQRADIARILEAQAHVLRLVDDLVGYSKYETGRLRFEIGDVIVRDSVDAVVSLVRPQAAAKNITIEIVAPANAVVALADEERLRQIVLNLLSNAVKFTPAGGHVSVTWAASGATVAIEIRDDGIGIPSEKLEIVFEPYVQLESRRAYGSGWGLGLAISRDLARAMGGDLTASSATEHGALFTLTVPRSMRIASPDTGD